MFCSIAVGMLGGLGLFLFGIQMMASGLQKAAGDKLRRILEALTTRPVIGVISGMFATMLVQSSSTITVMVVGFANAGLMTLPQAVGIIMGSNIGTTVTAQLISFKIDAIALPCVGLGALINFFSRRKLHRYLGQSILGLGLLFLGMSTMAAAMHPLRENVFFVDLLVRFGQYPLLGVAVGAIFTALIQSSSAVTGVVIALTTQGLLTFSAALSLILGANIGTCVTAMLASLGSNLTARRAAVAHIVFNSLGVIIFLLFFNPFAELITSISADVARQAANAHTIFNLVNTLIWLPFFNVFNRLIKFLVPGEEDGVDIGPKFLDKRMLKTPAVAIGSARKEILRMANLARDMVCEAMDVYLKGDDKKIPHILQNEELVDSLERDITSYLADLSQHSLTREQAKEISGLISAANDLERIADHAQNLVGLAEIKIDDRLPFSEAALQELKQLYDLVDTNFKNAIDSFRHEDLALAQKVIESDDMVDELERELRHRHIDRINSKLCYPPSGVIYLDALSNLERIADHATNLAQVVTGDF